ncbi:MAG: phosphotransferase [Clostridia bacterium]|nr:phosphotransferase [Clostridia bacterium]
MNISVQKERIIAEPEGSVTSANAAELEAQLEEVMDREPGKELEINAEKLNYISSAGLRMLLSLQKKAGKPLTVSNVQPEVYEVLEVTGFTTLLNVRRRLREVSVENCEIIGRGAFGTVYRLDEDTIVKVYAGAEHLPMIENEQKLAKQAFLRGIPTAIPFDIVRVGDTYGSVFEMVKAQNCADLMLREPENRPELIRRYAAFIRSIHSIEAEEGDFPDIRKNYLGFLDQVAYALPEDIRAALKELLEAMPPDLHIIHGDIQPKNVMYSDGEMMLIDMDTLSVGNPVFEFAGLFMSNIAYCEDEPDNTLRFYGIEADVCEEIYHQTLLEYLGRPDEEALRRNSDKIRVAGYLRFLYVILIQGFCKPELREVRLQHVTEHLRELLPRVDSLAI